MTIKQIYRKGIVKSIKDLFDKVDNNSSGKGGTLAEDERLLRNWFRSNVMQGFMDTTDYGIYIKLLLPKDIALVLKKYFDIPQEERGDMDFDFTLESYLDTGGGMCLIQKDNDVDTTAVVGAKLAGPTFLIDGHWDDVLSDFELILAEDNYDIYILKFKIDY